jgi:hypothetical protein
MVPEAPTARQEQAPARQGELAPAGLPRPRKPAGGTGRAAARLVTGEQSCQTERTRAARTARWNLRREGVWRISQQPRLWKCARYLHNEDGTGLRLKEGAAYYDGLVTCGSIWSCPVCAARIRQRRAGEIERAMLAHLGAGGGGEFATLTLSHTRDELLTDTLGVVQQAWKKVQQNGTVRRLFELYGVIGRIRATEITRGAWNGWHPHLHVLIFAARDLTAEERALLLAALEKAWTAALRKLGRTREQSAEHGVTLRPVTSSEVGNYLSKIQDHYGRDSSIGLEMARSDAKKGRKKSRTPFEVLESAADGVASDVALWHEYEAATKGRRAIEWSRGLKARFAVAEVEDEDLAAADVDGERIAWVSRPQYYALVARKQETHLLDLAEDGGAPAVEEHLSTLSPPEGDLDE